MQKGVKVRILIDEILKLIKLKSYNFDKALLIKTSNGNLIKSDKKLIYNVVLNSIRYHLYINEIIKILTKRVKPNSNEYFLLLSGITQIVFLNFKEFAVVNCTVELTKYSNCKASKNFINGVLRNVARKKNLLKKTIIKFENFPKWFVKRIENINNINKIKFIETILHKPDLHLVFKTKNKIPNSIEGIKTTKNSLVVKNYDVISEIPEYTKGTWWVQDLGAMMPLFITNFKKNINALDMCAAPGGKTFQLYDKGAKITAYEKDLSRLGIMKENMERLKINFQIKNKDSCKLGLNNAYDLIVLDSPCSAVGTIRRNPEIFFRKKSPNFNLIIDLQYKLLKTSSKIININGIILYIVCSFLKEEGENQIVKFLNQNKNFSLDKFSSNKLKFSKEFITNRGFFYTMPKRLENNVLIDGFFAARLKRNA